MLTTYLYTFGSVLLVSLISFAGAFALSWKQERLNVWLFVIISLAVGALLGDAFLHLIPESFEAAESSTLVALAIIGGILIFFVIEKVLHWHHHHGIDEPESHPVGKMVLISDGVHNLIDGLVIGLAYSVSIEVGIATTLAVILHEIPQEIGHFGVLLHSGYSRARALWLNFLSALTAVVGAALAFLIGESAESFANLLVPIVAGGFIYIALSDLIPELHKMKRLRQASIQLGAIIAGVCIMLLLTRVEPPGHAHGEEAHSEAGVHTDEHGHEEPGH